jgi:molybdopterin synthase catalytic subunit
MRIRLLAFASAADAVGAAETELELPDGADVARLRAELEARHPEVAALWGRIAVAVDGEIAGPETPLSEGVEVALLPPVSGGSGGAVADPPSRLRVALTDGPIRVEDAVAAVAAPSRGAVLLFLGSVRDTHRGRSVERLTYSAYRSMAAERLARIVREIETAGDDLALAIVHRLGEVAAAASPHRAAAYEASREALERLKREVPIWKREHYADGEAAWREEEPLHE